MVPSLQALFNTVFSGKQLVPLCPPDDPEDISLKYLRPRNPWLLCKDKHLLPPTLYSHSCTTLFPFSSNLNPQNLPQSKSFYFSFQNSYSILGGKEGGRKTPLCYLNLCPKGFLLFSSMNLSSPTKTLLPWSPPSDLCSSWQGWEWVPVLLAQFYLQTITSHFFFKFI